VLYKVCTEFDIIQVNSILEPEILNIARRKFRGTTGKCRRIFKQTRSSIRVWWLGRVEVLTVMGKIVAMRPKGNVR